MRYGKCVNCAFFNRSMGYCCKCDRDAKPHGGCTFHMTKYEAEREACLRDEINDQND